MRKISTLFLLLLTLAAWGCGDGEKCDCCKKQSDCKFGLKCVDLIGGEGKVCGEAGINYCSEDACAGSSSSKLVSEDYPLTSSDADGQTVLPDGDGQGTYALVEAFEDLVEEDNIDEE